MVIEVQFNPDTNSCMFKVQSGLYHEEFESNVVNKSDRHYSQEDWERIQEFWNTIRVLKSDLVFEIVSDETR